MKTLKIRNVEIGSGIPKIAVPIEAVDEAGALLKAKKASGKCDLLEIRADALKDCENIPNLMSFVKNVRDIFQGPVLFTLRSSREGGKYKGSREKYAEILEAAAISPAIDLVDIEYSSPFAGKLLKKVHEGGKAALLSHHDFNGTPGADAIERQLSGMELLGADIVKAAYMPLKSEDVCNVLKASHKMKETSAVPYFIISMGETGIMTRFGGEAFGSCMTFGCIDGEGSAPGQIEADILKKKMSEIHERIANTTVFLIGFMGTGKSSVASCLGRMLYADIFEMDRVIEEHAGMPIREIFSLYGEEYFRNLETEVLRGMKISGRRVVSCGGGTVLRSENTDVMHRLGKIYLLTAKPETILKRIEHEASNRPLLKGKLNADDIRKMSDQRRSAYEAAAGMIIPTDEKTILETAEEINFDIATGQVLY